MSREFSAPRDLVFDVFTDPDHISEWWGPNGFTTTTSHHDLRQGGEWIFVMHGPDGTDYNNHIHYREVVRPERLVYDHGDNPDPAKCHFHTIISFEDLGGTTRVTLDMLFPTAEARANAAKFGAIEGGNQTLARLAARIAKVIAETT